MDIEKCRTYAKRIAIFNGLQPNEVADIIRQGRTIHFLKGTTIFHQGQRGQNLFVVFSGKVEIYVGTRKIAMCRVGDVFGEMSVLDHRPHSATAVAATDVKLFTLDEGQLNRILEKRVAVRFLLNIIHILSGHLASTNSILTELQRSSRQTEPAENQGAAEH